MKKFYSKSMKALAFCAVAVFGFTTLHAQDPVTLNWKGGVSNDANLPENWSPVGGMDGNNLNVPHVGEYANPEAPNHPIVNRETELIFGNLSVAGPYYFEEPILDEFDNPVLDENNEPMVTVIEHPMGEITFSMPNGVRARIGGGGSTYLGGKITVTSGLLNTRKNMYLENPNSVLVIEGTGEFSLDDAFLFSKQNNETGGKIFLRDQGVFHNPKTGGIQRWSPNVERSILTISDEAMVKLKSDHRGSLQTALTNAQLRGGDGFYPTIYFDMAEDYTYVYAKPNGTPYIYLTSRLAPRVERLVEKMVGDEIGVEMHADLEGAQKFEWKYGTQVGGPYDNVLATITDTHVLKPVFDTPGEYFLVCEVTLEGGGVVTSNEIEYIVSPSIILLDHLQMQYLRGGRVGATVTAIIKEGLTALPGEWKYATTSGGPYQSFATPETALTYAPQFDTPGTYFVIYEAVVEGESAESPELVVNAQAEDDPAIPLVWTGDVNDDFSLAYNWNPAANPHNNNVIVPVDAPNWPVMYPGAGEVTIKSGSQLHYKAAVTAIVDEVETVIEEAVQAELIVRAGEGDILYIDGRIPGLSGGKLVIESGTMSKIGTNGWLELTENYSRLIVKGTGVALFDMVDSWDGGLLMLANNSSVSKGGEVHVSENGKVLFRGGIARISGNKDAEFSRILLSDNGQFIFMDDLTKTVATYLANNRFITDEGFEVDYFYSASEFITPVYVRDLSAFAIDQEKALYMSVGEASPALSLVNTGALADFVWKYNQDPLSEWLSFDTPVTGATGVFSFDTPGTYYVVAVAGDETRSSNFVKVVVVDFSVAISEEGGVFTLSVELPEGATASGWFVKGPEDTEYIYDAFGEADLTYTPEGWSFEGDGEYLYTFHAILKDENDQDVTIMATPVVLTIENGEIVSVEVATSISNAAVVQLGVYPNPSNGSFTLNVNADNYVVEVVDFSGAVVNRLKLSGMSNTITINSKGIYLLKVITSEGVAVQRVVVK